MLRLTGKQIFRLFIFLKKTSRKSDKTKRYFWLNCFPHLPLTRKAKGVRMGKGTGKLQLWFTVIIPGTVLVEFTNLRIGRSKYFFHQLAHKFATPLKFLSKTSKPVTFKSSTNLTIFATQFYLN